MRFLYVACRTIAVPFAKAFFIPKRTQNGRFSDLFYFVLNCYIYGMKTKEFVEKVTKTHKFVSGGIGLFLSVIAVLVFFKKCSTKNVSGNWYLELKVEKSAYKPYIGETHTQKVFLIQNENSVRGDGEKWEYNGKYLPAEAHRKIEYEGFIDGSSLFAKYVLHGQRRISEGSITVEISNDGTSMEGTFTGTAGESSGTVKGRKIGG